MWFFRQGQRAVEALGQEFGVPVERCFQTNPNVHQAETREVNFTFRGYRVRLGGARSRVACWLQGLTTTVKFALNRKDHVMLLDQPLAVPGGEGLAVFASRLEPPSAILHEWLGSPDNVRALQDLKLSRKESLQVYANAVVLVGEPHRAMRKTLSQLADLADRLPRGTERPPSLRLPDGRSWSNSPISRRRISRRTPSGSNATSRITTSRGTTKPTKKRSGRGAGRCRWARRTACCWSRRTSRWRTGPSWRAS